MEMKNQIDFSLTKTDTAVLKGIAICGMLCWHLFHSPNPFDIEYSGLVKWLSIIGDVCVSIFLFVSGYGLTIQLEQQMVANKHVGGGFLCFVEY